MMQFLKNLAIACLGMMLLVGMMAAGMMIWLVLLILIGAVMAYVALRKAGILQNPRNPWQKPSGFEAKVIEAEYTVISETENQITKDKV